ncbi:ATP phosphoribosyltransferase [Candidatus Woesearchaeota archaeon]|nr:ATP phosphoribosyltransferase [Candidatus Woesearchaeota archaeon]
MKKENKLKLGIPKGSLQESTLNMFKKAGFTIRIKERSYYPDIDDDEIDCMLIRAQEMARYVEEGVIDCGITGHDWVLESRANILEVKELIYAKSGMKPVRWVVAVPANSKIRSIKDLAGKKIATEAVNLTADYLKKNNIRAKVEFSWGNTEAKPPRLADAIVELTESGSTLAANNLKIIGTVLESTTRIIANKKSYAGWKKNKIDQIALLLKAALDAENKVGIKMNVEKKNLKKVLEILPAMKNPTISSLAGKESDWVAVESMIDEDKVRILIPKLKERGAAAIIEYPLNKVVE